jgi:hypothetical protein
MMSIISYTQLYVESPANVGCCPLYWNLFLCLLSLSQSVQAASSPGLHRHRIGRAMLAELERESDVESCLNLK